MRVRALMIRLETEQDRQRLDEIISAMAAEGRTVVVIEEADYRAMAGIILAYDTIERGMQPSVN